MRDVGLSPQTQRLIADVHAWFEANGDQIAVVREGIFCAVICTDLSDEEADARMATRPGSRGGWPRADEPTVACEDHPDTHRHIVYDA